MDEIESKNEKPDVAFMKQFISDKTLNQYLDLLEEINLMR